MRCAYQDVNCELCPKRDGCPVPATILELTTKNTVLDQPKAVAEAEAAPVVKRRRREVQANDEVP